MITAVRSIRFWVMSVLCMGLVLACAKKEVKTEGPGGNASMSTETTAPAAPSEVDEKNDLLTVHFDYNKADLTHEAKKLLKENAAWLKKNPKATVKIEGHCDERGSEEYNLKLGERRAEAVKHFLHHHGVHGKRLSTVSFGKDKPLDMGHDEAAWAKNRRASFRMGAE